MVACRRPDSRPPQRLVVEAWDVRQPWRKTRTTFRFRVLGGVDSQGLRILQTDHDPAPEFLASARVGDVGSVADAGAYVLFDQQMPPAGDGPTPELRTTTLGLQ